MNEINYDAWKTNSDSADLDECPCCGGTGKIVEGYGPDEFSCECELCDGCGLVEPAVYDSFFRDRLEYYE